jgi:hypothetical protein
MVSDSTNSAREVDLPTKVSLSSDAIFIKNAYSRGFIKTCVLYFFLIMNVMTELWILQAG